MKFPKFNSILQYFLVILVRMKDVNHTKLYAAVDKACMKLTPVYPPTLSREIESFWILVSTAYQPYRSRKVTYDNAMVLHKLYNADNSIKSVIHAKVKDSINRGKEELHVL